MGVRTTTYAMVGADIGSALKDKYPGDDELYDRFRDLMDRRRQKAGRLAIVEDLMGNKWTRVGLLLADPVRDDEPGGLDVSISPGVLKDWISRAQLEIGAALGLATEPQLLVFSQLS